MSENDASKADTKEQPRTETEDILEGNLIQKGDFDEEDLPDELYHSMTKDSKP